MSDIPQILAERGSRYGQFSDHATLSQSLQRLILSHMNRINPQQLEPYMVEALVMICHKLARIANGDPWYTDSWTDIGGYSQLVVEELSKSTTKDLNV
jgi:hypothetical protein